MNRSELIETLAVRENMPRKDAQIAVSSVFDTMFNALCSGERIEVRGFGAFSVRDYGQYQGRNPRTGQTVEVERKKLPFFRVGKSLRRIVDCE
jgi:integration host factor subunit beta